MVRNLLPLVALAAGGCLPFLEKSNEPKVTEASVEAARRADEMAKRIIDQNTFTGLEPIVSVVSVPDSVLFHRGSQVIISDGLIRKCKTDGELAAVLCWELGSMQAQKPAVRVIKRTTDPIPTEALPPGSADVGLVRDAELALQKRRDAERDAAENSDETKLARDLLKGAGFDPAELDRVRGMVKQSERGEAIRKQMAGAPAPTWNR
jgi:predicted Zn-dependent protease